jgi:hypothetical protein
MTATSVKNIQPGMVLSEDVVCANGRVLLKVNSEISEKHIKIFKTWGVLSLNIKSAGNESIKTNKHHSPDDMKRAISKKQVIFLHCDLNHPFMNELFRTSVKASLEQKNEKS